MNSPVKLVPYKDPGCVVDLWYISFYFSARVQCSNHVPVLWPIRATENTITKVLSEICIQKCWKWSTLVWVYSLRYYDVKICNFFLVINIVIHTGKIAKFRNLYKEQRYKLTYFYITEVQEQWFYFFLKMSPCLLSLTIWTRKDKTADQESNDLSKITIFLSKNEKNSQILTGFLNTPQCFTTFSLGHI